MDEGRVLLVSKDQEEIDWLALIVGSDPRLSLVGYAVSWEELRLRLEDLSPHVVLLDLDSLGPVPEDEMSGLVEGSLRTAFAGLCRAGGEQPGTVPFLDLVLAKETPFAQLLDRLSLLSKSVVVPAAGRSTGPLADATRPPAAQPADTAAPVSGVPAEAVSRAHCSQLDDGESTGGQSPERDAEGVLTPVEPWVSPGGAVKLIAYPFTSFRSMLAFHSALTRVEGVQSATICLVRKGTLHFDVEYQGSVPLESMLKKLEQFEPSLSVAASGVIEFRLGATTADRADSLLTPPVSAHGDFVLVS